jgi:hypothetical protein
MFWSKQVSDGFRHPLLLLVATAVISGLLVPSITQGWQANSRKAQIRADLIAEAGTVTADILIATQVKEFGGYSMNDGGVDPQDMADFKKRNGALIVVSAKMRAYLQDVDISTEWDRFGDMLTNVYKAQIRALRRLEYLAELRTYLNDQNVDWESLITGYPEDGRSDDPAFVKYNRAWYQLKTSLLNRYGAIAERILKSDVR